jgi:hypothetical protein
MDGKVLTSLMVWHPVSLPRDVNDRIPARISGGRLTQSGRSETDSPLRTGRSLDFTVATLMGSANEDSDPKLTDPTDRFGELLFHKSQGLASGKSEIRFP